MMYKRVHLFYASQPELLSAKIEEFINSDIPSVMTAKENNTIEISAFCRDTALYDSKYAAVVQYPDIM